jgi:hypothetical protein
LWPDGAGIVENTALGSDAVDVAAETVQALGVLQEMAGAMGDHSTAAWAARHRGAMLKAFQRWWIPSLVRPARWGGPGARSQGLWRSGRRQLTNTSG